MDRTILNSQEDPELYNKDKNKRRLTKSYVVPDDQPKNKQKNIQQNKQERTRRSSRILRNSEGK